jgi:hypothetical protein
VGGVPDIVMGGAIAGDGQTVMHREKRYKTLMLDDVPWQLRTDHQAPAYGVTRTVQKRYMFDSAQ